MSDIKVYISSVTGNMEMKKNQQRIRMILESKKIPFNAIDIALQSEDKDKMREIVGNPKALPPQVCNGMNYCGDFNAFDEAVEDGLLEKFLKME